MNSFQIINLAMQRSCDARQRKTGTDLIKNTKEQWLSTPDYKQYLTGLPDLIVYSTPEAVQTWTKQPGTEGRYEYSQSINKPAIQLAATSTSAATPATETWSYQYDANGNLTNRQGATIYSYTYDSLDRLIQDILPGMPPLVIVYDTNGNRTDLTFDAFGESNTYALNSNQLQSMGSSNLTRDAAGNRTSDRNGNRIFTYNNTGRLFEVYEGGSLIATYTYNAMGQRTRKVTNTLTTVYHYDLKGQLIYESSGTGQAMTTYLRTDTTPVAQIDHTPNGEVITYLHTDHLNTPRRATDSNGITVWAWQGTAFGSFTANEDPDNDGTNTIVNLRFPGQYYDEETQLHYNYFRYYDPSTGRYITSDPIGLAGGMNTYGYVGGNPLKFIDPTGLICVWEQSTGKYQCYDDSTGKKYLDDQSYSGLYDPFTGIDARNDPTWEEFPFTGPTPKGCYRVGGKPGDRRRNLIPLPGTDTFGRDAFQLHGGYPADSPKSGQASQGCPVVNRDPRDLIPEGELFCVY